MTTLIGTTGIIAAATALGYLAGKTDGYVKGYRTAIQRKYLSDWNNDA